jgi:5-methyltetrahydropteroyltriglutamate--homocysteine methyltransferase
VAASPHNPPFRADHVGSLRRPQALVDARSRYRKKEIGKDELGKAEDDAIREVVALQESIGLKSITDGEFRRQNYIIDFYFKAFGRDGIGFEPGQFYHRNDKGEKLPAERMVVKAKAKWPGPIFAEHFSFLKSVTRETAKITVPSPLILHFLGGNDAVLRGAYTTLDAFWNDLIEVYSKELAALHGAGCRYLQIDETSLVKFGDPEIRAVLDERGDDWQKLAASYVEVLNAILAKIPAGLNVGMHVCRGNRLGFWQADTGYEFMAEQIFKKLNVGFYLLEFDSARAGPLDALRLMRRQDRRARPDHDQEPGARGPRGIAAAGDGSLQACAARPSVPEPAMRILRRRAQRRDVDRPAGGEASPAGGNCPIDLGGCALTHAALRNQGS